MINPISIRDAMAKALTLHAQRTVDRKALLICSPGKKGANYIPGIEKDIRDFKLFLESPQGGLWASGDITILHEPSRTEVWGQTELLRLTEYALVVFSGHGECRADDTILDLGNGETIESILLHKGADKQTVILDCCRVTEKRLLLEERMVTFAKTRGELNPENCRKLYDHFIDACTAPALVVLSACKKGEKAAAHKTEGSYYIQALLDCCETWVEKWKYRQTSDGLNVIEAHEQAANVVEKQLGARQNPEVIILPKGGNYFPFCVAA